MSRPLVLHRFPHPSSRAWKCSSLRPSTSSSRWSSKWSSSKPTSPNRILGNAPSTLNLMRWKGRGWGGWGGGGSMVRIRFMIVKRFCAHYGCPKEIGQHIGWFLKKVSFGVFSIIILLWKAKIKCYLWASFYDIWPLPKSSKLDIQKAISAKQFKFWKIFLCKNKHYIVVVLVPNFHLSARSSSFFFAFFLFVYGELF